MHANTEIGTLQDIAVLGSIAHEQGVLFHTNVAQSVEKKPVDRGALHVGLLTIAGHKGKAPYIGDGTDAKVFHITHSITI